MLALISRIQGWALVAFLAVALVATGFGHRMPASNDADLQAYVLAGGSLSDLCADDATPGAAQHEDCPACQITGAAMLADVALSLHDADLIFTAEVVAPRESRAIRIVLDPARGLRAPPLV